LNGKDERDSTRTNIENVEPGELVGIVDGVTLTDSQQQ
jgi:hypothetical protein